MFAYCNNNPINTVDPYGDTPLGTLNLADYAFIHYMVQVECVIKYGWDMEIYVKGSEGRGYLDLLNVTTNEFYEVKSEKAYNSQRLKDQMKKYQVAIIADSKRNREKTGLNIGSRVTPGNTPVSGNFQYGVYDVHYELKEPGVITYRTDYNTERAMNYLAMGVMGIIGAYAPSMILNAFSGAIPLLA